LSELLPLRHIVDVLYVRLSTVGKRAFPVVTGQLTDKPTRGQSSRGLVNSRTSQLAEMFDL